MFLLSREQVMYERPVTQRMSEEENCASDQRLLVGRELRTIGDRLADDVCRRPRRRRSRWYSCFGCLLRLPYGAAPNAGQLVLVRRSYLCVVRTYVCE